MRTETTARLRSRSLAYWRCLIAAATSLSILGCPYFHPTDSELIIQFNDSKADFEALRDMVLIDSGVMCVNTDRIHVSSRARAVEVARLRESRLREYRELLDNTGIREVCRRWLDPERQGSRVYFAVWTWGCNKGIVFSKSKPRNLVDYLDVGSCGMNGDMCSYREIESEWYLYTCAV
jgi:hypothetical protein